MGVERLKKETILFAGKKFIRRIDRYDDVDGVEYGIATLDGRDCDVIRKEGETYWTVDGFVYKR